MNHIYQQLIHFLFSKKKIASYNDFFNEKVIKFVLIHCSWIILFAIIYYIIDIWIAMHPEIAKKYFIPKWVLESKTEKTKKVVDEEINRSKPFFYHLYFAALTNYTNFNERLYFSIGKFLTTGNNIYNTSNSIILAPRFRRIFILEEQEKKIEIKFL